MEVVSLKATKKLEAIAGLAEDDPEGAEVVLDDCQDVILEDVMDEEDLPPGWEDQLYEEWRERKAMNKEAEKGSSRT